MRFARIYLKGGDNPLRWVDWPIANQDMPFGHWVTMVRMQGGLLPEPTLGVFLPFDEIRLIVEITDQNRQQLHGFVMPTDGKPN